jgi:spermidine/putrescine transport system substrate-binding protein
MSRIDRPGWGSFSRREMLAAVGAAALAGCFRHRAPPDDDPERTLPPLERKLAIYNWSDYVAPATIPEFEREFGVRVTYDVFESNEEMLAKLHAGARGYDIVVPAGNFVTPLVALGLAARYSRRYVPNAAHLSPLFRRLPFDPEDAYTIPYQWGLTGIAWRRDLLPEPPIGWETFYDARLKGKLTQLDDMRDAIGAWLRYRGRSLNTTDPAALDGARADAIRAKANLKAYISAPVKAQLIAGDVWAAQLWNGDAAQARAEQPAIGFTTPREGSAIWLDSLVLTADAPHPRAAHEFMNYVLRPEVGADISAATGYGTPNAAAFELLDDPVPYPPPDELARLEYAADLGRATALWDRIWTEIKAA